jgi:hypothetical protein
MIALILLWSAIASAEEDQATRLAGEGRVEIAQGAYETGIAKLVESNKLTPNPDLLLEVAIAYSQWQGHCKDSIDSFDAFFRECRQCASFASAKERLERVRAACIVKVRIETTPPGAMISIDDAAIGASPLDTTVIAGSHDFAAELSGYDNPLTTQGLAAGQSAVTIKLELRELPAFIQLKNIAPESTVTVSGVPAKTEKMEVQPGRHTVEATRPGYESKKIQVVAKRGETIPIDVGLVPEVVSYRTYMWASIGIGAFSLIGAGAFALMAKDANGDARDLEKLPGVKQEDIDALERKETSRTRLAIILGSIGVAGAAAAVVFYLIEPEHETPPVAFGIGPEGLIVSGTF